MKNSKKQNGRRGWGSIGQRTGSDVYEIRFVMDGRRVKRAVGTSKARAEKVLRKIRALHDDDAPLSQIMQEVFGDVEKQGASLETLAPAYFVVAEKTKRASTVKIDRARLGGITKDTDWARADLATVTTADVQRWADALIADGEKPASVNRKLSLCSAILKWAVKSGKAQTNPVIGVERPSEAGNGRETFLSDDEIETARKACRDDLRPLFVVAVETGCRAAELRTLTWGNVDLKGRRITVQAAYSKTSKTRAVPLTDDAIEALEGLRKGVKAAPVFLNADGMPWEKDSLIRAWQKVRDAAPDLAACRFHDLRHTAASRMVAAGISLFTVGKILGHSTVTMTARYAHLAPKAYDDALDLLNRGRKAS